MPKMLDSLVQGLKKYGSVAKYQLTNNTISQSYEIAGRRGTNRAKAVGMAVGAGAATFVAPPVMVGIQVVKDYREKQQAEMQQHNLGKLTNCLRSHGISSSGAAEMANQVIMNHSIGHRISMVDFKMWMVVASTLEPDLAQYTPRIIERLESNKPQINLA
jgi:hypothetical protein